MEGPIFSFIQPEVAPIPGGMVGLMVHQSANHMPVSLATRPSATLTTFALYDSSSRWFGIRS
jgi:hypothetical protein